MLACTWNSGPVVSTRGWPSSLQVDASLARAETVNDVELRSGEGSSFLGGHISVEERVDVATNNIDSAAKSASVGLPDVERLGGSALAGVSCTAELALAVRDETRELGGRAVAVEDSLVSDDDELDERPLTPADDIGDLLSGTRNTGVADEDTQDHLQASELACRSNELESAAVGAVDTDGLESRGGNQGNINTDLGLAQAGTAGRVRRVSNGPLIARASNAAS